MDKIASMVRGDKNTLSETSLITAFKRHWGYFSTNSLKGYVLSYYVLAGGFCVHFYVFVAYEKENICSAQRYKINHEPARHGANTDNKLINQPPKKIFFDAF